MGKVSTFYVRIKRDRSPYSKVMEEDPVLLYGEMQIVYDDVHGDRIKFGNGRDPFSELPWYEDTGALSIGAKGTSVATLDAEGIVPMEQIPDDLRIPVSPVPVRDVVYNGEMQSPVNDAVGIVLTGITQAREVGVYMIAEKPAPGYVWDDGTSDTKFFEWSVMSELNGGDYGNE